MTRNEAIRLRSITDQLHLSMPNFEDCAPAFLANLRCLDLFSRQAVDKNKAKRKAKRLKMTRVDN